MRIFDYGLVMTSPKRTANVDPRRTKPGAVSPSRGPRRLGPDPLGEARPAANTILASWALRALLARRALRDT